METTQDLPTVALEALRSRITRILPAQIRACMKELSDEQLWWRPNEQSNSVGNLVLHVSGSMLHFLCRGLGGFDYQRNRPAEFAERGPLARQDLLAIFDEAITKAGLTLDSIGSPRLAEPSTEPAYSTVFDNIFSVAIHLATHTGQIVYVTKMLKEGAVDELWIQTHRTLGASKSAKKT